jgi:predicted aspartyl protease
MFASSLFSRPLAWIVALQCIIGFVPEVHAQSGDEGSNVSASYTEIPLTYDDGELPVVPVRVGTQDTLQFVLDTAAYSTVVAPWVRDRLGLPESAAATDTARGAGGQERVYRTLRLDDMQLGDRVVSPIDATIVDLSRFEQSEVRYAGILGNTVLKAFDVVVDLPNRRLRLYPIDEDGVSPVPDLETMHRVAFEDVYGGAGGFVKFRLSIGDNEADALLDTGASESIFNPKAAALAGWSEAEAEADGVQAQALNSSVSANVYTHTVDSVRVGSAQFPRSDIRVIDLPVFQSLGMTGSAVILGNDLIADRRLVIAYSTGDLYLSDPITTTGP